jgi:hypothetical protein
MARMASCPGNFETPSHIQLETINVGADAINCTNNIKSKN